MQICDEDFENIDPGEPRVLIAEEGIWPAQFVSFQTKTYGQWGEKLIIQWRVFIHHDKSKHVMLCRFYNLQRDRGNRLKFGPLHDYRKDWIAANGGRHPLDRSKLPLSIFKCGIFSVEVVTVRRDSKNPLSPSIYWSKIGRVIRPVEGTLGEVAATTAQFFEIKLPIC